MPSNNRRLPALVPVTNSGPVYLPLSGGTPPATSQLAQPVAEYAIRVRNASRQLVGEIRIQNALFTLRYNNVSAWAIQVDASDPLAGALAANGAGIQVLRTLRDPATGSLISSTVLLSGPRWGRVRQMQGNTLVASGYDDLLWLQGRLAYPVLTAPNYAAQVTVDTPAVYLRLGEASGTAAADSSGNARPATYFASPLLGQNALVDDANTAATFNGTSQYVATNAATGVPSGNANWTQEVWFTLTSAPAASVVLSAIGVSGTNTQAALMVQPNLAVRLDLFGVSAATSTGNPLALNVAHHLVGTYNGAQLALYLDGVQVATQAATTLNITAGAWYLAARNSGGGVANAFAACTLDECALYGSVLSLARIQAHYAYGISRFGANAYDTRVGAAETVIRQYVDANAVTTTINPEGTSRVVAGLTLDTDQGRGNAVTGNARFDQLVLPDGTGLLQQLAQSGGLGFRVTQSGTSLLFSQYVPTDRTASVIFSNRLGNLADFSYSEDGPDFTQGGNAIMVGGGGVGTARVFVARNNAASITEWGLFEGFQDARDTTDVPTLTQRGDAALAQAASQTQFACTLAPQRALVYGQDFSVGDSVTVVIDGVSFANLVREVQIKLDYQGAETVTPAVGTPNADTIRRLFGGYVQQHQLSSVTSTANKLARSQ